MLPAKENQLLSQIPRTITAHESLLQQINPTTYHETIKDIQHHLKLIDVDFEGKQIPISILPTLVEKYELEKVAQCGSLIHKTLEKIIQKFRNEHIRKNYRSPLHYFFNPYEKWFDLIASEVRQLSPIQLMRYDAIRSDENSWKFLETNTCCPGGVISCGKIRNAWLMTKLGYSFKKAHYLQKYDIDSPDGFLQHLFQSCKIAHPKQKHNVAICNFKNTYQNEFQLLKNQYENLRCLDTFKDTELIICDIREIEYQNNKASIRGLPISLIYNKLDPLMIDPQNQEIDGWLKSSQSPHVTFLNSVGAMYLTETKRTLALLRDKAMQDYLHFSPQERNATNDYLPQTEVICTKETDTLRIRGLNKDNFVIKADALTRGAGVYIGSKTNHTTWGQALIEVKAGKAVLQEKVSLPIRQNFSALTEDILSSHKEYYGIDLFYFGNKFSGAVSRGHTNEVFNIGNGGKESPLLVITDKKQMQL